MSAVLKWLGFRAAGITQKRLPHERWPEILEWQEGDVFDLRGAHCGQASLVSITEDGSAYVLEGVYGPLCRPEKWNIASLVGNNRSLRSRRVSREMARSNEYMDLLREFNAAVEELRQRDKRNGVSR